jgi:hypothetical protein
MTINQSELAAKSAKGADPANVALPRAYSGTSHEPYAF